MNFLKKECKRHVFEALSLFTQLNSAAHERFHIIVMLSLICFVLTLQPLNFSMSDTFHVLFIDTNK